MCGLRVGEPRYPQNLAKGKNRKSTFSSRLGRWLSISGAWDSGNMLLVRVRRKRGRWLGRGLILTRLRGGGLNQEQPSLSHNPCFPHCQGSLSNLTPGVARPILFHPEGVLPMMDSRLSKCGPATQHPASPGSWFQIQVHILRPKPRPMESTALGCGPAGGP